MDGWMDSRAPGIADIQRKITKRAPLTLGILSHSHGPQIFVDDAQRGQGGERQGG